MKCRRLHASTLEQASLFRCRQSSRKVPKFRSGGKAKNRQKGVGAEAHLQRRQALKGIRAQQRAHTRGQILGCCRRLLVLLLLARICEIGELRGLRAASSCNVCNKAPQVAVEDCRVQRSQVHRVHSPACSTTQIAHSSSLFVECDCALSPPKRLPNGSLFGFCACLAERCLPRKVSWRWRNSAVAVGLLDGARRSCKVSKTDKTRNSFILRQPPRKGSNA